MRPTDETVMPPAELIAFAHGPLPGSRLARARRRTAGLKAASGLRLATAHLELWPCSAAECRASLEGPGALAAELGMAVPETWPPAELEATLAYHGSILAGGEGRRGWGIWLLALRDERCLVGSIGFKGRPDRSRCVEVGYGIEPGFRRRGFATEALACLVEWAWTQGVARIVAECHEDNRASAGVLERTGLHPYERRGKMLWWELRRPS